MAVNPVLTGERRNQYTSSGSLGPYNFTFVIYADADIAVYVNDTLKTLTTHYTVSTNANGTGSITFTAGNAPASGTLVTIIGNKDLARTTVFTSGGPLTADALETEFNSGLALLQQLDEKISRAITLPIETDATRPIEFPYDNTEANNANRIIKFNAAGSALELGSTTTNIDALAAVAADIAVVSGISADVTAVAADATDIGIVSSNISSVQTVATNINDVITVANDLNEAISEVETVANDLNEAVSEIDTVGNNITYVQTVGDSTNIANITTVAGQITPTNNISTLATISSDITQAATDSADIQTVASDSADIRTLADIEDGTVATNAISNAGNNSTNITTVAGQISPTNNISTVATAATNIATVAGQISPTNNISTVAGANANISTVASNLTGANTIGTVATDLSGSNTIGTVATNITDVQDVAANISGVNSFAERYRVASSDPTTSLDAGDLAFNTTGSVFKYYDGSSWQQITAGGITDIAQDSTPQLGGNLDLNSNDITGTGNVDITGNVSLTGTVDGRDIAADGTKLDTIATSATANPNAIDNVVEDTTPQLGGNLDLNSSNITGTGNINITGTITSSGDITTSGVLNSIAPTRHSIRPSLNLDFANSKVLDPRITFTRGSNATYYDGYTSVKAEENQLTYSNEISTARWVGSAITTTINNAVSPDGTTTASLITASTSSDSRLRIFTTQAVSTTHTFSVYAKAGSTSWLRLRNIGSNDVHGWFNLTTGVVGTVSGGTSAITSVGSGWYRCSVTATSGASITNNIVDISAPSGDNTTASSGGETIYVWGVQLEANSTATALTVTTTAPITKYQPALQTAGNNVARFDHNPTTGESLGLLIEESRTNLQVYSEEFNNGAWTKSRGTIIPNIIVAPDGTLTGDQLLCNTTGSMYVYDDVTISSGATTTLSFYLKKGTRDFAYILSGDLSGNYVSQWFNIFTGTVGTSSTAGTGFSIASASIEDVGNDWYRCIVTTTTTGTILRNLFFPAVNSDGGSTSTADIDWGYIWGFQIEQGSFPTSYIKTTGSQVTRSNEEAVINNIDTSDWYKQGVGTWFADFKMIQNFQNVDNGNDSNIILNLSDDSSNVNRFEVSVTGGVLQNRLRVLNNNYDSSLSSLNSFGGKVVLKFENQNHLLSFNGTTSTPNTSSPFIPIFTQLKIGRGSNITGYLDGRIKKVSYYPKALTDNEITDLSEE